VRDFQKSFMYIFATTVCITVTMSRSKETYIRQKRPSKESYVHLRHHSMYHSHNEPIKRDLYSSKETFKRDQLTGSKVCIKVTGRRRCIGSHKSHVSFRKRATNLMALLRKMTYKAKASYGSLPPCSRDLSFPGRRSLLMFIGLF